MSSVPEMPNQPQPVPEAIPKDDKNLAMLAHLLGIFFGFIPSLIIWLLKKDSSKFVEDQAKEALNFQIIMTIALVVSGMLIGLFIGCLLYPACMVIDIIFCIKGAMAASKGIMYRYPWTVRLIK